jgi:hypothetical protein
MGLFSRYSCCEMIELELDIITITGDGLRCAYFCFFLKETNVMEFFDILIREHSNCEAPRNNSKR